MSIVFDHNLGSVWQRAGGNANGMSAYLLKLAWLTPQQRCRAERLRQARMLFDGRHRQYFLDEGRTQHDFPPLKEGACKFFEPYNLLTNVAQKMADLLFGEACRVHVDDQQLQTTIDAIVDRSWLPARLNGSAVECCWAGYTFLEISRSGGNAMISHTPAEEIYPLGVAGPDYQFGAYVRYATQCVDGGAGKKPRRLLLETKYTAGLITRACYELDQAGPEGESKKSQVSIEQWPERQADGATPLLEQEATGLSRPSLIYVPNGYEAASDFDQLIDVQDAMHAKNTQIARVIAKHADPKLAAPEAAADPKGNLPRSAEVYFYRDKNDVPSYITWNAELEAASQDRDFARSAFSTIAEMPLSLLGVKDDSSVETASKMRLSAAPALAKAARKATFWQAAIRLAVALAVEAESGSRPVVPIGVEMKDGLPIDSKERADEISSLRSSGVLPKRRALQMQGLDQAAVDKDLQELDDEAKQSTPSVLLSEPGMPGPNDSAAA